MFFLDFKIKPFSFLAIPKIIPNKPLDCVYPISIFVNICFIYISFRTEIDQTLQLLQVVMEYPSKIRMDRQTFTSGQGILQQNKDGQNNYFYNFYNWSGNITAKWRWTNKLFTTLSSGLGISLQNKDGQKTNLFTICQGILTKYYWMDKLLQVVREFYNKIWIDRQTFYKRLRNITTKYGWKDKLITIVQGILQQNKDGH